MMSKLLTRVIVCAFGGFGLYKLIPFLAQHSILNLSLSAQILVISSLLIVIFQISLYFSNSKSSSFIFLSLLLNSVIIFIIRAFGLSDFDDYFLLGSIFAQLFSGYCIGKWGYRFIGLMGLVSSLISLFLFFANQHLIIWYFSLGVFLSNISNMILFYTFDLKKNNPIIISHLMLPFILGTFGLIEVSRIVIDGRNTIVIWLVLLLLASSIFIFIMSFVKSNSLQSMSFNNKKLYLLLGLNSVFMSASYYCLKFHVIVHFGLMSSAILGWFVMLGIFYIFPRQSLTVYSLLNFILIILLSLCYLFLFNMKYLIDFFSTNLIFFIRDIINNHLIYGIILMICILSKSYISIQIITSMVEKNRITFMTMIGWFNLLVWLICGFVLAKIVVYLPLSGVLILCMVFSISSMIVTYYSNKEIEVLTEMRDFEEIGE